MQGIMSTLAQLLQNLTKGRGGVTSVRYFLNRKNDKNAICETSMFD